MLHANAVQSNLPALFALSFFLWLNRAPAQKIQLQHIVGVERELFKGYEVLHVKGGEGMMEAKPSMSFMIRGKRVELNELEQRIKVTGWNIDRGLVTSQIAIWPTLAISPSPNLQLHIQDLIQDHMRPLLSKCCLRKGKVIRQKDPKSTEIPKGITCALCKRLLRGLINLGLSCQDCGKKFGIPSWSCKEISY